MQYIYMNEWGYGEIRTIGETEEFDIAEILGCQPNFIKLPKWHREYTQRVQANARNMIRQGKAKDVYAYIQSENRKVRLKKRGLKDGFQVERIPPKYTGGKHLMIAFRPQRLYETLNPSSYIISTCLHQSIKGRRENKVGKLDLRFYSYGGPCIIFDDWGNTRQWKGRDLSGYALLEKKGRVTFPTLFDFQNIVQSTMMAFQMQERVQQHKMRIKAEGNKFLFNWLQQQEDIEDDYKETLKRFLLPISGEREMYAIVKNRILEWQEADREHPGKPRETCWWFPDSKEKEENKEEKEEKEDKEEIVNPRTGRKIKVGGPVYKKLKAEGLV